MSEITITPRGPKDRPAVDTDTALPYISVVRRDARKPMHSVADYLSDAKDAGLTDPERAAIVTMVMANPEVGDVIRGAGGARKFRVAGRGKGKSGGYRVITFFSGPDAPVFLLNVFAKGDRVNLTQADRNSLAQQLPLLVSYYLNGVAKHVESRRSHSA